MLPDLVQRPITMTLPDSREQSICTNSSSSLAVLLAHMARQLSPDGKLADAPAHQQLSRKLISFERMGEQHELHGKRHRAGRHRREADRERDRERGTEREREKESELVYVGV